MPLVAVAAITAAGAFTSAEITKSATENSANLSAQSTANTLAFQKQQAEALYQQQTTTAKANYDQWAAHETAMNQVRTEFGLPPVAIPAFVPQPDPNIAPGAPTNQSATNPTGVIPVTSAATAQPTATTASMPRPATQPPATPPLAGAPSAAAAPTSVNGQNPTAYARTLLAKGMAPQQVAATISSTFGTQAQYQMATGTIQIPGQAPILVGTPTQSVGAYLQPPQPGAMMPTPFQPQSIGSYLQGAA